MQAIRLLRFEGDDFDGEPLAIRYRAQGCHEADVIAVGRCSAAGAMRVQITQRQRPDLAAQVDRVLERRRMKRQHACTISRRALREHRDAIAGLQCGDDCPIRLRDCGPGAALDEDRLVAPDQPADERPLPDVRLAHEAHRTPCRKREHIEPRDVVRHDEARPAGRRAMRAQLDPENVQQPARPPLADARAPLRIAGAHHAGGDGDTACQMQADARETAEASERQRRFSTKCRA